MDSISFEDLGLDDVTLTAIAAKGFEEPTPIQVLAIPRLLNGEANVIAKARTGTGKTAAFGLPLVQTIRSRKPFPQALILTPTRELALLVAREIESLTSGRDLRIVSVYGGQSMGIQLRELRAGVEIVVGTPGRIKDHIERGSLKLENLDYFILDEADEMLDMGFIEDIEMIFSKANPESRVLLFSATMPPEILRIASRFMGDYEIVEEEERPEEPVLTEQRYLLVREQDKTEALVRLMDAAEEFYGLVFTQTKNDADMVARDLDERGYEAAALHGDIPQAQREKILSRFRRKKTRILVATDVAARGIDIEGLTHVINYALPFDGPTYVHRIGRTGRAGASGTAYTFVRPDERRRLNYIRSVSRGNLKEGKVPSVTAVIEAKRERLMQETLAVVNSSEAAASGAFAAVAAALCEGRDPVQVLSTVLAHAYSEQLDSCRYGEITPVSDDSGKKQLRVYVGGMGRRTGAGRRDIARFFSDLLDIPERLVDRIEITDSFALASLPADAAMAALELGKRNRSLPHMHLDVKGSGNSGEPFHRGGRPGRNDRYGNPGRRDSGPQASGRPRSGSASLYRRRANG